MTTLAPPTSFDSQWIDGGWQPSTATRTIDVINPATEETLATVPAGTERDADRAARAAAAAFPRWAATPLAERLAFLERFVGALENGADHLADIITAEV